MIEIKLLKPCLQILNYLSTCVADCTYINLKRKNTYMFPSKQFALLSMSPVLVVVFTSHRKQDISLNTDFLKFLVRESSITLSTQSCLFEKMYGISEMDM